MSAQAAKRRRSNAVMNRPSRLKKRYRTSSAANAVGFAGKLSKTAKKSMAQ